MIRANAALCTARTQRADQRIELWDRFLRSRRRQHRNLLAESYLPLVRTVAEEVAGRVPRSFDAEDLFSVGVCGLLQAIESFDATRGVKFETFCRMRIRGAMIDELRRHDRLSREARERTRAVAAARRRLCQELTREPTHHELAQSLGLSAGMVERILDHARSQNVVSLELELGAAAHEEEGESLLLGPGLVDGAPEPLTAAQQKDLLSAIERLLSAPERTLIKLRYEDGLTMRRIGRRLGISESRVCQRLSVLLLRLQERLAAER